MTFTLFHPFDTVESIWFLCVSVDFLRGGFLDFQGLIDYAYFASVSRLSHFCVK